MPVFNLRIDSAGNTGGIKPHPRIAFTTAIGALPAASGQSREFDNLAAIRAFCDDAQSDLFDLMLRILLIKQRMVGINAPSDLVGRTISLDISASTNTLTIT